VSHELKTPLTVIAGFAETLRDPQLAGRTGEIHRSGRDQHGAHAAHRRRPPRSLAIRVQRLDSAPSRPRSSATVDDLFRRRVVRAQKSITLVSDIDPGARMVRVDPTAIRQVLANLIENAVRYTSSGTVTVRTSAAEGGGFTIAVSDTGIGIPPIICLESSSDSIVPIRRDHGLKANGARLAIVRHLVEAHGGRVAAQSTPGAGTTVVISFPRSDPLALDRPMHFLQG